MATVKYLSSFDELTWCVNADRVWTVRADIKWAARPGVRNWIIDCCSDTVWVWNGTSSPEVGTTGWHNQVTPHKQRCYLLFSTIADNEMFLLKYTDEFNLVYFGNDIQKAWHDSKL